MNILLNFPFVSETAEDYGSFAMAPANNKALVKLVKEALQHKIPLTVFETSDQLEAYLYDSAEKVGGIEFHLDDSVSWN